MPRSMRMNLPQRWCAARFRLFLACLALFAVLLFIPSCKEEEAPRDYLRDSLQPVDDNKSLRVLIPTFLGNEKRKFYGRGPVPRRLAVVWKLKIGGDSTRVGKKAFKWLGTGWTGQPALVCDNGREYLIIGGYDHVLRRIDAETGKEIWKYSFDDVIKGSCTLLETGDDIVVLQGSRLGFRNKLNDRIIPSFRAISFNTGRELWRFNIPGTGSCSRDVDGSPAVYRGRIILGAENGMLYILDPLRTELRQGMQQPVILGKHRLFENDDIAKHGGNIVTESSPAIINDIAYVSSGSGHIYGIDLKRDSIVWDFRTGSDLDGSVTVTADNKLLCAIEKQYIEGKGGMIKIDPTKAMDRCVEWYFPTGDRKFASWEGGVVGSQAVSERSNEPRKHMVAFQAIDGCLYVVSLNDTSGIAKSFDNKTLHPRPKLLFKKNIGGSISTPIFVDDCLIAQGYAGMLYVIKVDYDSLTFSQVDSINIGCIESTPIVWQNRIFVGSRNGYFYCIGEKQRDDVRPPAIRERRHRESGNVNDPGTIRDGKRKEKRHPR
jgi:outer membrane protein assembly factor BamB